MSPTDKLARRDEVSALDIDNPNTQDDRLPAIAAYLSQEQLMKMSRDYLESPERREAFTRELRSLLKIVFVPKQELEEELTEASREVVDYSGANSSSIDVAGLQFQSEEEAQELAPEVADEIFDALVEGQQENLAQRMQAITEKLEGLSIIAQARIGNVEPGEIIPPEKYKTVLSTELGSRQLLSIATSARKSLREILQELAEASPEQAIKAQALVHSMGRLVELCTEHSERTGQIPKVTDFISRHSEARFHSGADVDSQSEAALTVIAKTGKLLQAYFENPNRVLMVQASNLRKRLDEIGAYNAELVDVLLPQIRAIGIAKDEGDHQKIKELIAEFGLDEAQLDELLREFEKIVRLLDSDLNETSVVVQYIGEMNRDVISSLPPAQLDSAAADTALPPEYHRESLGAPLREGGPRRVGSESDIRELTPGDNEEGDESESAE